MPSAVMQKHESFVKDPPTWYLPLYFAVLGGFVGFVIYTNKKNA